MNGKDLAEWVYSFLIKEGQHSMKFKLGENITNTPDEVRDIIRKHINEIYEGIDGKWYKKDW